MSRFVDVDKNGKKVVNDKKQSEAQILLNR